MKASRNGSLVILAVFFVLGLVGPGAAFAAGPAPVNLGAAGNFVILGKTGISTTGTSAVTGNIGVSPAAATYITGFGLIADTSNTFSTSALVNGKVYAADYTAPTPTTMTTAISDMQTAYTDAAGRTLPTATELGAGNIGGMTLAPGLYKWSTGVVIPTNLTLSGGADDVWIFQIAQNLDISSATNIILNGGAQAKNIFWQVAGQTTIGTTAVFSGTILDQTAIVLKTGAVLNGRALAQTAVTLDASTVTSALFAAPIVVPAMTTTSTPAQTTAPTVTPGYTSTPAPTAAPIQTPAAAVTASPNDALQKQINGLMATLQSLRAQVTQRGASVSTPTATPSSSVTASEISRQMRSIVANLRVGSTGSNVEVLQQFLIEQGKGAAAQALANNGVTMRFGALTRAALAEFQASVGISPAAGNFGPVTRAYIQANY